MAADCLAEWPDDEPITWSAIRRRLVAALSEQARRAGENRAPFYRTASAVVAAMELPEGAAICADRKEDKVIAILSSCARTYWYELYQPKTSGERAWLECKVLCEARGAAPCSGDDFAAMASIVNPRNHALARATPLATAANLRRLCDQYCAAHEDVDSLAIAGAVKDQALLALDDCLAHLAQSDRLLWAVTVTFYELDVELQPQDRQMVPDDYDRFWRLVAKARVKLRDCMLGKGE